MKITGILSRFYSYFFNYDIFISYTRADSKAYARKLYDQLTSLDYTCFIDNKEAPAGGALNTTLMSALKASKTLVLVGTEISLERKYVQLEFKEFTKTLRPIIPIDVDQALTDERLKHNPWNVIKDRDLIWLDETGSAINSGLPSPEVYEGIQNYYAFTKRNVIRRRWVTTATLVIIAASIIAFFQTMDARAQRKKVFEQTMALEINRDSLQKNNARLIAEQNSLKLKTIELQSNKDSLDIKTKEASENARKAKEQEGIALKNAREAKLQQQLAEAQAREAKKAQGTADVRWLVQLANSLGNKYPEQRTLILLEALRRNHGKTTNEAFLEQSLRTSLETFDGSIPLRHLGLCAVDFSPDGHWLATGSEDGSVCLWDIQSEEPKKISIGNYIKQIGKLQFSPDSHWLVGGCLDESYLANQKLDGKAHLWHIGYENTKPITLEILGSGEAIDYCFTPNVNMIAVRFANEKVWLWEFDSSSGPRGNPIELLKGDVTARIMKFSPDGKWFITGNYDSSARLWDTKRILNGVEPIILSGHDNKVVRTVDFSPNGQWLVTTSSDGQAPSITSNTARLWKLTPENHNIKPIKLWIRSTFHPVRSVKFSEDSKWIAMQAEHEQLRVWRLPQKNETQISDFTLSGHNREITAIAFSPDNTKLASGSYDGMVKIWDLTWEKPQEGSITYLQQNGIINDLAFTPNSQFLYSGSSDWTVYMFNVKKTNESPYILSGLEGGSYSLNISPDKRFLFNISYSDERAGFDGASAIRRYGLAPSGTPQPSKTITTIDKGGYAWQQSPDENWLYCSTDYESNTLIGINREEKLPTPFKLPSIHSKVFVDANSKWFISFKKDSLYFTRLLDMEIVRVKPSLLIDQKYNNRESIVENVVIDQAGHWAFIAYINGQANLYDLSSNLPREVGFLKMPDSTIIPYDNYTTHKVSFSPDGKRILLINSKKGKDKITNNAILWNLSGSDGKINLEGLKLSIPEKIAHTGLFTNNHLIITEPNGSVAIWNLPFVITEKPALLLGGHKDFPTQYDYLSNAYLSPNNNFLITFSEDSAFIWNLNKINQTKEPVITIKGDPNGINGFYSAWDRATFSNDSRWMALVRKRESPGPLRSVTLVDLKSSMTNLRDLTFDNDDSFDKIEFSKSGKWLATGGKESSSRFSEQNGIQLWDLSKLGWGKRPIRLLVHNSSIDDFKFSADEANLFSTSIDRSIIKWDLNTLDPSHNFVFLKRPTDVQFLSITSLFPSKDGKTLYAATKLGDGISGEATVIEKWLLTTESLQQEARRVIGRNLKAKEWRKFFGSLPQENSFTSSRWPVGSH